MLQCIVKGDEPIEDYQRFIMGPLASSSSLFLFMEHLLYCLTHQPCFQQKTYKKPTVHYLPRRKRQLGTSWQRDWSI